MSYAELGTISNFSFLRGGSHPGELVAEAAQQGLGGLGLCDRNTFAGVVRAHVAMRDIAANAPDFRYLVGTRLVFKDSTPDILAYPTDRSAYGRLCALLTRGNLRADKGDCHLFIEDLADHVEGQLFIILPDDNTILKTDPTINTLKTLAPNRVWLGASCRYQGHDRARLAKFATLAERTGIPLLATNDVLYHTPERRPLQDVLTCIRDHFTLAEAGRRLEKNAERHIKPPAEMTRLFREYPTALEETSRFADLITFSLDDLQYEYPEETIGNGETAQQTLERLTWAGAKKRYPDGIPERITKGLIHELALIAEMKYAPYFLTVQDMVHYARVEKGILCQGRGSAANSAVCFCLGVTEVNPMLVDLLFERFVSTEREEPPDIDVDFEHERREEVIQYLYEKYGRHRAGIAATVITYRTRGAVREVAKVLGLSVDVVDALNGLSWGSYGAKVEENRVNEAGLDPNDHTLQLLFTLVRQLIGFPRHLSQHVGGFVITRGPLNHLTPVANATMENRTTVEWDKDDLDALKILKVDVLALGMLTCIRRAFDLLSQHYDTHFTLASVPAEDPRTYKMTHRADTLGVFQIESRAQMSMLPRLKPIKFYDLVVEVAIVRPGPIQGDMVHPYLRRRQGLEKVEYPKKELEAVLDKTYGVPLFQEQAMKIAIVAGGFTPGEADQLRRAMATFRRSGTIGNFRTKMINGMLERGYEKDFAERCFKQIEGFADYGFPESHAASFALLVYVSCWLKCHYPDVFACALLNSQPMGFYAPAQIVRDAREHGVDIRPVDINFSDMDNALETNPDKKQIWKQHEEMAPDIWTKYALRLGFSQIKGLSPDDAALIVARRGKGYDSVRDVWLRTGLMPATLERLAAADIFQSIGLDRRTALWAVRGLKGPDGAETLPLFATASRPDHRAEPDANLPPMPPGEDVIHDYKTLSLSLKAHPVSFLREAFTANNILTSAQFNATKSGRIVTVAGLVLVRQRPGTASGVIFQTLEDETGVVNTIVWPKIFEANRRVVLGARLIAVKGQIQKEGLVTHLIARQLTDYTPALLAIADGHDIGSEALSRATKTFAPNAPISTITQRNTSQKQAHAALPSGRNFH